MPDSAIQFRNVSYRLENGRELLHDLNLEVRRGETLVLLGRSGSGKTTTLKLINRLLSSSTGEVLVEGRSTREWDVIRLRRMIGYVIQDVGLFPHFTVARNIGLVPQIENWPPDRIQQRVEELLEHVGLDHSLGERYPRELSGGQRQRVGVARALAADPPLLLMDEPFGAIDPINRMNLQNEFLRLQNELRKTVVFVTHDIDEAIKMGDRIAVLKEGGVLAQYAPPAELLMRPADEFVAGFVGADAALKRLALGRVSEVKLRPAPEIRDGEPPAAARERARDAGLPYPLLVDEAGRPSAWLRDGGEQAPVLHLAPDEVLRNALDGLLRSEVQYAAVLNGD